MNMKKKRKVENVDYNKLLKMREDKQIQQEINPNPFLLQVPQTDKGLYKALYKFNSDVELEEYNLPLGQKDTTIKKKENLSRQQSVMNHESVQNQYENEEILEDNENEDSQVEARVKETNYKGVINSLFGEKSKKQVNKIQNALFVDQAVYNILREIKTGEEAISFFAKYANTTPIKFIYCTLDKTKSSTEFRPYDLKVIHKGESQKELTLDDYYTISVHGIVHVYTDKGRKKKEIDGSTEVVTLSEWMHESTMFNIITNIHFFKQYVKTKLFRIWYANVRKRIYNQKRQQLIRNYFLVKPTFSNHIMEVNKLMHEITLTKCISTNAINSPKVWELDDFKLEQKRAKTEAQNSYSTIMEKLNQNVGVICKEVVERTYVKENEEENNQFSKQDNKQKPMNQIRKEKEMRQYRLRLAEKDKDRLDQFIRMVDYMSVENLVATQLSSMQMLLDEMKKENRKNGGIFNVNVIFNSEGLIFTPDEFEITESIQQILKQIISVVETNNRVFDHNDFEQYLKGSSAQGCQPEIESILLNSLEYKHIVTEMENKITKDYKKAQDYVDGNYEKCRPIYNDEADWNEKEWVKQEHNLEDIKKQTQTCKFWNEEMAKYIKDTTKGIVNVDSKSIKTKLQPHVVKRLDVIKKYLYQLMRMKADVTLTSLRDNLENVGKQPTALSEFAKFIENLTEAQGKMQELDISRNEIENMHSQLKTKFEINPLQTEDYVNLDNIQQEYVKLQSKIKEADEYKREKRNEMVQKLDKANQDLMKDIQTTQGLLNTGKLVLEDLPGDSISDLQNVVKELPQVKQVLNEIKKSIDRYKQKDKDQTHYQKLMEETAQSKRELVELENGYNDRKLLWTNIDKFRKNNEEWLKNPFNSLDTDEIERDMKQFESNNVLLSQRLANKDGSKDKVLQTFILEINQMSIQMPVIVALGNKDLKPRHWKQVFELLGMSQSKNFNLSELMANGVLDKKEQMEEISGRASGEAAIELQVENIQKKWQELNFVVMNYKEYKDKYILGTIDEIIQTLDDHQVSVQTMLGTRFVQEIRPLVEEWEKKLVLISEIIDEWLICQRQWMYLENIFNADDIQKQLPQETSKFFQVDKFWKDIMSKSYKHPLVVDCCNSEELLRKFQFNNKVLDDIQKQLENYLETKRRAFARFYFLANDEIIQIISQTGNPSAVQQHLRKCFDNINRIKFGEDEDSKEILAMISADPEAMPEVVPFDKVVQILPEDKPETWLTKIEIAMLDTLYQKMMKAVQSYPKSVQGQIDRAGWLLSDQPAQCTLTVDQIGWTSLVTDGILKEDQGKKGSIKETLQILIKQITKMVDIIRKDLTIQQRTMIGALAVLDVHNRQVTADMVENGINKITDFDWTKQLKFYIEKINDRQDVVIRQTNTRFEYGYEYLGNGPRLVITKLTDRCYMTLTGALHLYYGGAPQGPAGTGKTETTKDLGKALAVNVVVFNCSGNMDFRTMGRFFSGLAQCGAWSCFDEFNRIEIEVLSVIAQQILTIQLAIRNKDDRVEFEGRTLPLSDKFGVFITMNPGYAGRTELPDNLKALFRPVSMMIPDYSLIAEISLFSEGFQKANVLANKMYQLYQLSSQQLSKQKHYDFGMRALKSVLVKAGSLRRSQPDLDEDIVLIRAMRDSNLPKFLSDDIPLFMGIIQDLFPGVDIPTNSYPELERAIHKQLTENNLQIRKNFIDKQFELFEIMTVRHGVMIVGFTGTGKTKNYEILSKALKQLYEEGERSDDFYRKTLQYKLNPKSVTMNELFGYVNVLTNEWSDGIVAKTIREAVEDLSDQRKWIIFDGPVDALWIENMNTVLDDNKMLCLSNGQRIKLNNSFTLLFEVNDLAVASPATVSRCGMVYMDYTALGWEPILDSWSKTFSDQYIDKETEQIPTHIPTLVQKMKTFFQQNFEFVRKECQEVIPSQDINLVQSCINILEVLYQEYKEFYPSPHILSNADTDNLMSMIFIFSFIWSVGANLHDNVKNNSRVRFSQHFKSRIMKIVNGFPFDGDVYDYYIDFQKREFRQWTEMVPEWTYDPELPYFSILVPTSDTVKFKYLLNQVIRSGNNVLFNGETGTGKSVVVQDYLYTSSQGTKYTTTSLNFSAQTQSKNILDIFIDKDKFMKKKKDLLGPAKPGTKMIFFCDDVNMPTPEKYRAQPPIELLRQIIDHGGFYDLQKLQFMNVKDVIFVAACGPPTGGKNEVTPRLFRRFNMMWIPDMPQRSLEIIFGAILKGFLSNNPTKGLEKNSSQIVRSSIEIYKKVTQELLPTPSKCHYNFNLRDLSKVFQGILQIPYNHLPDKDVLMQLWCHESQRVFYDRLVDTNDRNWFLNVIQTQLKENLDFEIENDDLVNLLFGDYANSYKEYMKIEDPDTLNQKFTDYLQLFNANHSKTMNLVFFRDAINHLSRIIRVLRQFRGNSLLIGVGGSGRGSLTRLSSYIRGYQLFSIEITKNYKEVQWKDDLKKVLKMAGCKSKPGEGVVFLFSDTQIVMESFLEDLNNILNTGEVPNLMAPEDFEEIINDIRNMKKEVPKINVDTRESILKYFVSNTRDNLHIVLTFSPVGDKLRTRCREFSSIINCCTIDWFDKWPDEALYTVAQREYKMNESLGISEYTEKLSELSVSIHNNIRKYSDKFYDELKRTNYTTPTSYLELLKSYIEMLKIQQNILPLKIRKYTVGLQTLSETNEEVGKLQQTIIEFKPRLEQNAKENAILVEELKIKTAQANETEAIVSKEAGEAQVMRDEVNETKQSCQNDLAEALPALNNAKKAVENIDKQDIAVMKNLKTPPALVQTVMGGISLLLNQRGDDWDSSKKLLGQMNFREMLLQFGDKIDTYPEKNFKKFRAVYLTKEDFTYDKIYGVSQACASLFMWATAVDKFQKVKKEVGPKEQALKQAEKQLKEVEAKLEEKMKVLKETQETVAQLNSKLEESQKKAAQLQNQQKTAEIQLQRAEKLLSGLGNEAERWKVSVALLNEDLKNLVGNILLSAAFISYLGPFTNEYRTDLIELWKEKCINELQIPTSSDFNLQRTMTDEVQIRDWQDHGLPADQLSTENGILIQNCRRWPLVIDPQNQANKWIRKLKKDNNLQITKLTQNNFLKILENCIRFGNPCLIENVEQELDPALEPVLQKQVVKKGASYFLRLGDTDIPYNNDFKLYITTKLPNPVYLPEISIKVTIINFTVTPAGLEDQLLVEVVRYERIELEEKRISLILQISQDQKQLQDLEDKILKQIGEAQGRILDDEELITTLDASKITSNAVNQRVKQAKITSEEINIARENYRIVARRGSVLYFSIAGLSNIDPMYQYSLEFFIKLFIRRLDQSPKPESLQERLDVLIDDITKNVYRNICRGLFEKDKLIFSYIMAVRIALQSGSIKQSEWNFFLSGAINVNTSDSQMPEYMIEKQWQQVIGLSQQLVVPFKNISYYMKENKDGIWQRIIEEDDPFMVPIPEDYKNLTPFQSLLMYNVLRPAKLIFCIKKFILDQLGQEFTESPLFDLQGSYEDSDCTMPIIFILSPGAVPIQYIIGLAKQKEMIDRFNYMSLGQGQEQAALERIITGRRNGDWVCLQNCHLFVSWLPELERIQENMVASEVHPDYRLWLTSDPNPKFPVPVLQSGIKLTNEPPKGLRANLKGTYNEFTEETYNACSKQRDFQKLMFSLAFFHTIILERRKFGSIGWNIPYQWMNSDFIICNAQLKIYLEEQEDVPYQTLNYIFAEVNYGGRVTDSKDTRLIIALLKKYFNPQVLNQKEYLFSENKIYQSPNDLALDQVRNYILSLPDEDEPEVFGLHQNANIVFQQNVVRDFMNSLILVFPRSGGGGGGAMETPDQIVAKLSMSIEKRMVGQFKFNQSEKPDSLEVFRNQELDRLNQLIKVLKSSLSDIQKAIKGTLIMSHDLEMMYNSFLLNKVPEIWANAAYPSQKPLASWVEDLFLRFEFFKQWINNPNLDSYWISSFFFPQGFLTACLQIHARKTQIAIDTLVFQTKVQDYYVEDSKGKRQSEGINIHGCFIQGCRYDPVQGYLIESKKKELFTIMPVIWIIPIEQDKYSSKGLYQAPLYKTSTRSGELSTTGQSTNFVVFLDIKSKEDPEHWVRRGVALLCQLDD